MISTYFPHDKNLRREYTFMEHTEYEAVIIFHVLPINTMMSTLLKDSVHVVLYYSKSGET